MRVYAPPYRKIPFYFVQICEIFGICSSKVEDFGANSIGVKQPNFGRDAGGVYVDWKIVTYPGTFMVRHKTSYINYVYASLAARYKKLKILMEFAKLSTLLLRTPIASLRSRLVNLRKSFRDRL